MQGNPPFNVAQSIRFQIKSCHWTTGTRKYNSQNSFSDKHNLNMMELWQNTNFKKLLFPHVETPLRSSFFLALFLPAQMQLFPSVPAE